MQKQGLTLATPLFLCFVCIELSDFVFAVDSIPAILGVSKVGDSDETRQTEVRW